MISFKNNENANDSSSESGSEYDPNKKGQVNNKIEEEDKNSSDSGRPKDDEREMFMNMIFKMANYMHERSAIFILAKAVHDVVNAEVKVEHSIDKGIYSGCISLNS